jgi:hypothetical protein
MPRRLHVLELGHCLVVSTGETVSDVSEMVAGL